MRGCSPLTPNELRLSLRNLKGRFRFRDRALVTLGVFSGLRIGELLSLRVGQVWDGSRTKSRFYLERSATKGRTRGACIVLHPRAADAITQWLTVRPPGSSDDYLFPSQKSSGKPFGRQWAWRRLNRVFRASGAHGMLGTHTLRKTFAARFHRKLNGDLFALSRAMRHSSPITTLAYLEVNQGKIDRAILNS